MLTRRNMSIQRTNIVKVAASAIVNAANETLEGGGGVDGAIHAAAGPLLLGACRQFPVKALKHSTVVDQGRCDVGEVIATKAFEIDSAKYIFHTVAPILSREGKENSEHLKLCYRNCLRWATEMKLDSLAFCCLGTGFYGFPKHLAARLAVSEAALYPDLTVIFCVYEDIDFGYYKDALNELC